MDRPSTLYKYRAVDSQVFTERIFSHHEVYFASPSSFNDPFEGRFRLSMTATHAQKLKKFRKILPSHKPNLTAEGREALAQQLAKSHVSNVSATATGLSARLAAKTGILSLSAHNDDILMWPHYADNHRGICLEFAVKSGDGFLARRILPVHYTSLYPVLNYYSDSEDEMAKAVALTKSAHWSYEAEWRVVDPFVGPGVQVFPPALLTGVVLGSRLEGGSRAKVLSWVAAFGSPLQLYQASLRSKSYELDIKKLP